MSSFDDWVLLVGGPPFLVALWILVALPVWSGRMDGYEHNWVAQMFVWDKGRDGFNAMLPAGIASLTLAYLGVLPHVIKPWYPEAWWGAAQVIGVVFIPAGLLGMLFAFTLLLFMRPRFLAPPHLRGRRGWIPAALHSRHSHREGSDHRPS